MLTIPQQKITDRWDELPYSIREAIFSERNADILENIAQAHNFNERQLKMISTNVGDVLRGFMHLDNLTKELIKDLNINEEIATAIVNEIKLKVFEPVHEISGVYKPLTNTNETNTRVSSPQEHQPTVISPSTASPIQTPQSQTELKPSFKEPVTTSSSPRAEAAPGEIIHPAPFLLHEEKPPEGTGNHHQDLTTQRPTFYQPIFSSGKPRFEAYTKQKSAMVEWGDKEIKKDLSVSLKTSPQQVRVVHYSELKTEVDPFGGKPTTPINPVPATAPLVPIPPVHPNNVVDLKDLPLK